MKKHILSLLLICISACSFAQINESQAIDSIFTEWNNANAPGCALGIIEDGKLIYAKGYGMANMEYNIPNAPSSVFRIGSTSKQFTAACIVLLAKKEELNLDNTLDQYFPDFPNYAANISIRNLLNHTSGIRDYLTIAYLKGFGDDDYYQDNDIMKWLENQSELNFNPGDEFLYSNSGYWLLGQIVNQVAGMNMADFAQKELFKPLGMSNTHFHNDHTQIVKNRASGYVPNDNGGYNISMTTLDMIGDGGIFTTVNDIKKWDDAYYNSSVLSKEFWNMMTLQGVLNNGEVINYASGLSISKYKGLKTIRHGGAFVGFRAELLRFPDQRLSIAIFANRGDADPSGMADQVADILLKEKFIKNDENQDKVESEQDASKPKEEYSLKQIAGNYEIQPGVVLKLTVKNDSLNVVQGWNNSEYNIVKTTGNTFQMPDETSISFTFFDLKDGFTQQLEVLQNGNKTICKRQSEIAVSKVNLNDYSGVFYSKELDATYNFYVENNVLKVKVRNNEPQDLDNSNIDQFFVQGILVRFKRENGLVSSIEVDAGRVKNLKFQKN